VIAKIADKATATIGRWYAREISLPHVVVVSALVAVSGTVFPDEETLENLQ
jgi:hypothetical protein